MQFDFCHESGFLMGGYKHGFYRVLVAPK